MFLRRVAITLTAALAVLELTSTATAETISAYWDNVAFTYIQRTGSGPQTAARMMTVMHAAMYDAWTVYDPVAVPTRANGILKRPPEETTDSNKIEAISFAAHKALVALLPSIASGVDTALADLGYDLEDVGNADTSTPAGIGNVAADAVITLGHYDAPRYAAIDRPAPNDNLAAWQQVRPYDGGRAGASDSAVSGNRGK